MAIGTPLLAGVVVGASAEANTLLDVIGTSGDNELEVVVVVVRSLPPSVAAVAAVVSVVVASLITKTTQ